MTTKENALNWFELPALDIQRAKKFYETIFGIEMPVSEMMGMQMAKFAREDMNGKVSGALVQSAGHKPSMEGAKIYLNGNPDLSHVLAKVEKCGGKITMQKMKISDEIGSMAFIVDTEGNLVGLHSNK